MIKKKPNHETRRTGKNKKEQSRKVNLDGH